MTRLRMVVARLRGLLRRRRLNRELGREVDFHLAMLIEANREAGMDAIDARRAALRSFGAIEPMKERYREGRTWAALETFGQDFRYAWRSLRRSPGATVTSVAVLAVALGANTTVLSVINAELLRPLPFDAPDRLAMLWNEIPSQGVREGRSAYLTTQEWRSQSDSFTDMAVFDPVSATLTGETGAIQVSVARVSPNLLDVLGVRPAHGRQFSATEADERRRVALISDRFWRTRYGGSLDAVGAPLEIDGLRSQIIGILPEEVRQMDLGADVWEPHTLFADWDTRRTQVGVGSWFVLGRLAPGVSYEQAQVEMNAVARRLAEAAGTSALSQGVAVVPLEVQLTGGRTRLVLWMLAGAVFCVLLIAGTNVASLALARGTRRAPEMAIRAALGAGHWRIVRQLITESLVVSGLAGLLGLALAAAGLRAIVAIEPAGLARVSDIGIDPLVVGWALVLCLATGVLVGLAPAFTVLRRSRTSSRPEGSRGASESLAAGRIRRALVGAEFALAIVLLAGAGLFVRSLWSVQHVNPGFRAEGVLSIALATPALTGNEERTDFYSRVLDEVRSLPEVENVGVIGDLFIGGSPERALTMEGAAEASRLRFRRDEVTPDLFATLGTPLRRGRAFTAADRAGAPPVAIVNEAMAAALWPGRDAIGKRFKLGGPNVNVPWFTVVGVVANMRRQGLETQPNPQLFEPLSQNPSGRGILLVRTSVESPLGLQGLLQAAVHRVDPRAVVYGAAPLDQRMDRFLQPRRLESVLLLGFALAALLIAAIGIYGLMQYSIATRTREIAIRLAIGARPAEIVLMIMGEGLKLTLAGLVIGLAGALLLGRTISSLLYEVSSADPLTFGAVSVFLVCVAAAACYLPARRVMRLEPMDALRLQ